MIPPIMTIEEFLSHAIAIEREAIERYREFELQYSRRGESVLAGLCANLAALEGEHLEQLRARSAGLTLPAIDDHAYRWLDGDSPEAPERRLFHAAATRRDLLMIALRSEAAAQMFFAWVARTTPSAPVRHLAEAMALEEAQHVSWLEQALSYDQPAPVSA